MRPGARGPLLSSDGPAADVSIDNFAEPLPRLALESVADVLILMLGAKGAVMMIAIYNGDLASAGPRFEPWCAHHSLPVVVIRNRHSQYDKDIKDMRAKVSDWRGLRRQIWDKWAHFVTRSLH